MSFILPDDEVTGMFKCLVEATEVNSPEKQQLAQFSLTSYLAELDQNLLAVSIKNAISQKVSVQDNLAETIAHTNGIFGGNQKNNLSEVTHQLAGKNEKKEKDENTSKPI